MKKTIRCFSYAMIGLVLILASATTAFAHVDPPGSSATGISISITAFRADQVTPIGGGSVNQCETIYYQLTIGWAGGVNAAIEGGTLSIVTPDLVSHDVTPVSGVPCLGGTVNEGNGGFGETCAGSPTSINSDMVQFVANVADCTATPTLAVSGVYAGGVAHNGTPDQSGVGATTPFTTPVVCCALNEGECKEDDFCDPTVAFGGANNDQRLGTCVAGDPLADSTVCADTDGTLCTTSGCEAGLCVQAHATVTCTDDGEACNGPEACVPGTGLCASGPNLADSTACTLEDNDGCTTSGCEAGVCVATHQEVTCTEPLCEECIPATGLCEPLAVPDPSCIPGDEICRTPGFWGTHGGTEKDRSNPITGTLLDAFNLTNDPDLVICGTPINNVTCGSPNSALEAICVSPKGDSRLQLARQLTAAALNCIISNGGNGDACVAIPDTDGAPCGGVSIETIFNACNATCESGDLTVTVDLGEGDVQVSCIGAIDCFNNGFNIDPATGACGGSSGCHENDLDNGCASQTFTPPGPAGSSRECNESRKNEVNIFSPGFVACPTAD